MSNTSDLSALISDARIALETLEISSSAAFLQSAAEMLLAASVKISASCGVSSLHVRFAVDDVFGASPSSAASVLGSVSSLAKVQAARRNGTKGGRPRKGS